MSEVFEGVLFASDSADVLPVVKWAREQVPVDLEPIGHGLMAVFRTGGRDALELPANMERVAGRVSDLTGRAILLRYDSRVGYRAATLFQDGQPVRLIGLGDERWAPVDEHGEPVLNGPTFSADELDPSQESDTVRDVVHLGLVALGFDNWDEVMLFIAQH